MEVDSTQGALHRAGHGVVPTTIPGQACPPVEPLVPNNASADDESTVRVGVRHVCGDHCWQGDTGSSGICRALRNCLRRAGWESES